MEYLALFYIPVSHVIPYQMLGIWPRRRRSNDFFSRENDIASTSLYS